MQYTRFALWLFALSCGLAACVSPPDYPDEPIIVYEGISKNTIYQFRDQFGVAGPPDSLVIHFSFTDGDGNISSSDTADIFITDSRLPQVPPTPAAFPFIPNEGTGNGISGDLYYTISNFDLGVCCIYRGFACIADPNYPVDTFSYEIYIMDRAGNRSNTIRTEQIQILCLGQ